MSARAAQRPALTTVIADDKAIGMILNRGLAGFEAWTADEMSLGMFMSADDAHAALVAEAIGAVEGSVTTAVIAMIGAATLAITGTA